MILLCTFVASASIQEILCIIEKLSCIDVFTSLNGKMGIKFHLLHAVPLKTSQLIALRCINLMRILVPLTNASFVRCDQLKNKSSRRVTYGNPCYSIGSEANSIYFLNDRSVFKLLIGKTMQLTFNTNLCGDK
jgi:hypothetical protein